MARKISVIQQQIIDSKNADPVLSGLDSPSQTAYWNLWAYITAVAINLLEQVLDVFTSNTKKEVSRIVPGTSAWLRNEVLKFQYSVADTQVVVVKSDFSVGYAMVNEQLQIITRASVKQGANNVVNIKVAKAEPPEKLVNLEKSALVAYLDKVGYVGVQTHIISVDPDRLYVQANVYYNGQYSSTIKDNVIAALKAYMTNLSSAKNFDGIVRVSAIEDAIQKVTGVTDVQILSVKIRMNGMNFSNAVSIVRSTESYAGYVIPEDSLGNTLNDSIVFMTE